MSTINGCGTKILGDFEYFDDGSYMSIKWFVIFYIPLFPIEAYRVYHEEDNLQSTIFVTSTSKYNVQRIPMKWKYVWRFLRVIYVVIFVCIGLLVVGAIFHTNLLVLCLCILGMLFVAVCGLLFLINQYDA